jgi:hypothetical protein
MVWLRTVPLVAVAVIVSLFATMTLAHQASSGDWQAFVMGADFAALPRSKVKNAPTIAMFSQLIASLYTDVYAVVDWSNSAKLDPIQPPNQQMDRCWRRHSIRIRQHHTVAIMNQHHTHTHTQPLLTPPIMCYASRRTGFEVHMIRDCPKIGLVVSGYFSFNPSVGNPTNMTLQNIAIWDGSKWNNLDGGVPTIESFACRDDGSIFVTGAFAPWVPRMLLPTTLLAGVLLRVGSRSAVGWEVRSTMLPVAWYVSWPKPRTKPRTKTIWHVSIAIFLYILTTAATACSASFPTSRFRTICSAVHG